MKKISFVFIMAILAIIIPVSMTFAQSCSTKEDCQNLINQYSQKLSSIRDQKNTLSSQINIMDTQIILTTVKIQDTQYTIKKTEEEIDSLSGKIDNLNTSLDYLSKVFLKKVSDGYKRREAPLVDIFIDSETAAKLTNRLKYMQVAQDSDRKIAFKVEQAKANYEDQKKLREVKKAQLDQLTKVLAQQQISLEQQKSQKQQLLVQTGNDETTYQRLLASAQAQISAFTSFVKSSGAGSVIGANSFGNGSDGNYFSQRDARWATNSIGNSNENILNVGCLLTSVSMVLKKNGVDTNPAAIASNTNYFSINTAQMNYRWQIGWPNGLQGHFIASYPSSSQIDNELSQGHYVIVGINYGGCQTYSDHFVVITRKEGSEYKMHDPLYGPDINFSSHYSAMCWAETIY